MPHRNWVCAIGRFPAVARRAVAKLAKTVSSPAVGRATRGKPAGVEASRREADEIPLRMHRCWNRAAGIRAVAELPVLVVTPAVS